VTAINTGDSATTDAEAGAPKREMVDVFSDEGIGAAAGANPVGYTLAQLADGDERVVTLSADMSGPLGDFRDRHADRYFEFGIAETNAVGAAAGMAAAGLRPYVVSMAPFGVIKTAEQIRTDWAYNQLPVRMVARLSGLAMGFFGPSHQAIEDIAVARAIDLLDVIAPADANSAIGLLHSTFDQESPIFFRICEGLPPVYSVPPKIERGKWVEVRPGTDVTVIGTGIGVSLGVEGAKLVEGDGISVGVLDAAYLAPYDEEAILNAARTTGKLLVVEEHSIIGGLGSLVAEVLGRHGVSAKFSNLAIPAGELEVGVPAELRVLYGFTPDNVATKIRELAGA
jgi:transketolase